MAGAEGDFARQAVASLRGYAYQLVVSALAWLDLEDNCLLQLEVAEDYSIVAKDSLVGFQVKYESGSITLNAASIATTINALFTLRKRNPGRQVRLAFLTTSRIGKEKLKADQVEGMAGLEYWASAARGHLPITPLRNRLKMLDLSDEARSFLEEAKDEEVRSDLLGAIDWITSQAGLEEASQSLLDRLIEIGDRRGLAVRYCEELAESLLAHCLRAATAREPAARTLRRADLLKLIDAKTTVTLNLNQLVKNISPAGDGAEIVRPDHSLDQLFDQPLPDLFARRPSLTDTVLAALAEGRMVWVYGMAGIGKSLLARHVAEARGGHWKIIRLREADATRARAALRRLSSLSWKKGEGIVLDDLDQLDDPGVVISAATLLTQLSAKGTSCVVTGHRRPSAERLQRLGCPNALCLEVPSLSEAEVHELVLAGGGKAIWSRYVYLATGGGQPILVQALLHNLKVRNWPPEALQNMEGMFSPNAEIDTVREETRRRLLADLPAEDRVLLYRTSLLIGSFERSLLDAVAGVEPALKHFGESLSRLVGPWIERTGQKTYRLTPLLSKAGDEALSTAEAEAVHRAAALHLVGTGSIAIESADSILLHGLAGKTPEALSALVHATLRADEEVLALLEEHTLLGTLQTSSALVPNNPILSAQLRVQQVLITASGTRRSNLAEKWQAMQRELDALGDRKEGSALRLLAYSRVLRLENIAADISDFMDCLTQLPKLAQAGGVRLTLGENGTVTPAGSLDSVIFGLQICSVEDIALLDQLLTAFCALPADTRKRLKSGFREGGISPALAVKSAWAKAQSKPGFDHERADRLYTSLASRLAEANEVELAAAAYETVAAIRDEALKDSDGALSILDKAKSAIGSNRTLDRARARILMGRKDYAASLPLFEGYEASRQVPEPVEEAFGWREIAVCRAYLGDWMGAADAFAKARQCAGKVNSENMTAMEVGLRSDEAVALWIVGRHSDALSLLTSVYDHLEADPDAAGLRSEAIKRLFGHTVLWVSVRADPESPLREDFLKDMVPGANSNPSPHPELAGRVQPDRIVLLYLLAAAERKAIGSGPLEARVSNLSDEEACLSMEALALMEQWREAIRSLDPLRIASLAPRAVDLECAIRRFGFLPEKGDMTNLERGRVGPAEPLEFEKHTDKIQYDLSAVLCVLSMQQKAHDAVILISTIRASDRPVLNTSLFAWFDNRARCNVLREQEPFSCAVRLLHAAETGESLSIEELFIVTLRFLELGNLRGVPDELGEAAYVWARSNWPVEVRNQSFALKTPPAAIAALDTALGKDVRGFKGLALIVQAITPFVKTNVGQDYLKLIDTIARVGIRRKDPAIES